VCTTTVRVRAGRGSRARIRLLKAMATEAISQLVLSLPPEVRDMHQSSLRAMQADLESWHSVRSGAPSRRVGVFSAAAASLDAALEAAVVMENSPSESINSTRPSVTKSQIGNTRGVGSYLSVGNVPCFEVPLHQATDWPAPRSWHTQPAPGAFQRRRVLPSRSHDGPATTREGIP
jgi:hypothetical protein